MSWTYAAPPANYAIRNVRAVLPDRIVDDAAVVVRDGRIGSVESSRSITDAEVDGGGMLLMPGFVDIHTDALEKERMPRPNAELPWEFAIASFESKLVGAGITTVFHGAGFQHHSAHGKERSVGLAQQMCAHVAGAPGNRVDHRVLHRLDIRSQPGVDALRAHLASLGETDVPPLVSHEDHTPGQGQYVDRTKMEEFIQFYEDKSDDEARAQVDGLIAQAERTEPVREATLRWLGELARAGQIRLVGHDPDTAEVVEAMRARGVSASEFPTTVQAARRSHELGLDNVAGAPNVLRGRSHAGNVSAAELVAAGLVDALASDYLPSGLLAAAWALTSSGLTTLPQAVGLITSGPARVAGLTDRGRLEPGLRADLVLVDDRHHRWPQPVATLTSSGADVPARSLV